MKEQILQSRSAVRQKNKYTSNKNYDKISRIRHYVE